MTTEQMFLMSSVKHFAETGRHFGVSDYKIRRVLISAGVYMTAQSREILKLYEEGLSSEEMEKRLKLSRSAVFLKSPLLKGQYNSDTPHGKRNHRFRQVSGRQIKRAAFKSCSFC